MARNSLKETGGTTCARKLIADSRELCLLLEAPTDAVRGIGWVEVSSELAGPAIVIELELVQQMDADGNWLQALFLTGTHDRYRGSTHEYSQAHFHRTLNILNDHAAP